MPTESSRREFIKTGAAFAATTGLFNIGRASSATASRDPIRVGLVGCGGRGTGALKNFIEAAKLVGRPVEVVALADAFTEQATRAAKSFEVPESRAIGGLSAYRRVMESNANFVILATPPVFRPVHFAAAVAAGKNVFIEKPIAVDPVGVRKVLALGEQARAKGLAVVAGTQRRHDAIYLANKARVDAGAIGEILGGVVMWNGRVPWIHARAPGESNRDYLLRNWLNFVELSGDHIVEQHVHNLDVANWFLGRTPVSAVGMGARMRRETGNQYDFFSVDFDYGNGVHIHSQCRQISGCYSRVGEFFRGPHGDVHPGGKLTGKNVSIPEIKVKSDNSLVQEHVDLIESALAGRPENRVRGVCEATMTALMGRISAYTGKLVRWADLMELENSPFYNLTLAPAAEDFEKGGDLPLPAETIPLPGDGAPLRARGART